MREERMFILKMIEEGKITAQEGAALLEALRDDVFDPEREPGEREPQERQGASRPGETEPDGGAEGGPGARTGSESREEGRSGTEAESRSRGAGGEEARRHWPADVAAQIMEAVQAALKGVPQVTDELKDNWKEVAEDLRQSFQEIREEIRKRGLVDVSGLVELFSHIRDMGFGHIHEFVDEVEGTLSEAEPRVELSTTNGSITVRGWDKERYRLVLRKRLHSVDEARAKEIAREMVDLVTSEGELRATARHVRNASVSMELWLPKENRASLKVRSENGSVRVEDVSCREAGVSTSNGAVTVSRVAAEWVSARTTNGRIECSRIRAERAEAHTTNGSVHWGGAAKTGEVRTVNGAARLEPEPPAAGAPPDGARSEYDVSTVNGSVHVELPDDDETGVSVVAHGRSVRVEGNSDHLSLDGGKGERRGATVGYGAAPKKIDLRLSTVNGAIRVNVRGRGTRAAEGGEPDSKRADADPQDA